MLRHKRVELWEREMHTPEGSAAGAVCSSPGNFHTMLSAPLAPSSNSAASRRDASSACAFSASATASAAATVTVGTTLEVFHVFASGPAGSGSGSGSGGAFSQ